MITETEKWIMEADGDAQKKINDYILAASKKAIWKIEKDSESLLGMEDSDERIQTSNRFKNQTFD